MSAVITAGELQVLERDGLVTIDGPLSTAELARVNAVLDAKFPEPGDVFVAETRGRFFEPEIVAMILHPFWERLAQTVLAAETVELASICYRRTTPKPDASPALEDEHVDFMATSAEINCRPRRMLCGCMLWLTAVPADAFPLHFRPGSHLQVMEYADHHADAIAHTTHQMPPPLSYTDPVPVLAGAGQLSILHGTLVHSGSVTPGTHERRAFFVEYKAKGLDFPYYTDDDVAGRTAYLQELRRHAPPERHAVLPDPPAGGRRTT